ncbi:MAG: AI-2E family transporter [Rhodospirillaceae bacterium]|nr:AI-2E family transporter [Rhodospirillales bacterium]
MDALAPITPPQPAPPQNHALTGLLVLAVLYTLYFAAELILPILLALLLALVLAPVVHGLRRMRVPRTLAAGLVTGGLLIGLGWGVEMLAAPAADWLQRAPQSLRQLERKLLPVRKPVEQVTKQVERLAAGGDDKSPTVKVKSANLGSIFVAGAGVLVAQIVVVAFLLFFLLASGDRLLRRAARVPKTARNRRRLIAVARRIKHDVASYLGIITLINMGLGTAAGLILWALGMPNPALWGVVTMVLNYIPYAGAFATMVVVGMVGVMTFDELWRGLLPAAAIVLLHVLESDLITPTLVGRHLTLPPMVVFLSLTIWTWMWGIAGAMLAVPLLVILKVAADHLEALQPLAPFLGGPNCGKSVAGKFERPRSLDP